MIKDILQYNKLQSYTCIAAAAATTAVVTFCGCKAYNRNKEKKIESGTINKIVATTSFVVAALVFAQIVFKKIESLQNRVLFMTGETPFHEHLGETWSELDLHNIPERIQKLHWLINNR